MEPKSRHRARQAPLPGTSSWLPTRLVPPAPLPGWIRRRLSLLRARKPALTPSVWIPFASTRTPLVARVLAASFASSLLPSSAIDASSWGTYQVPWLPPSNTPQASSTSTVDPVGVKFLYETCTTTPKFRYKMYHYRHRRPSSVQLAPPLIRQENMNHYFHDDVCTTIVDLEDPVDIKFLDVTPNIYGVCTTTKRVRLLPLRPVNNYFPRRF